MADSMWACFTTRLVGEITVIGLAAVAQIGGADADETKGRAVARAP